MFRNLSLAFVLCLAVVRAATAEEGGVDVFIELSGLAGLEGNIYVAVYDSKKTWLGDETVHEHNVSIADAIDGEIVKTQFSIAPGDYAFSIYYDENNNGKADRALGMMPREGFGFSRDAKVRMGPPSFSDAALDLGGKDRELTIRMRYML